MELFKQLVIDAPAPLFLARISPPVRLPVALQKITIHKDHIKQERPSKSLPSAAANRVIIALICPHLVSSIDMIHLIVISSSYCRD
jgi:hypothetical protein